ncbi:hypothetical protein SMD20_34845 [Nonomuraea sp. LP-02]|uniref:hypothetical protein n=1 Tax=Nonomuraea sp. LP-02 TaxID=3097960 RepID=UPI002E34A5A7|nr:hypothetical protein [Nonomuraea sp. LP-02]MED7929466.1 hypothetical protein [Nonomuraea sp. LP-02]
MSRKSWALWGAVMSAGLGIAVNLATEMKYNMWAWAAVVVVVVLTAWGGFIADQSGQRRAAARRTQPALPVLHWDKRSGSERWTVSTTDVKVATEFLKSVGSHQGPPQEP